MYMSGHKNESCSSNQKEALSDNLSAISSGAKTELQVSNLPVASSQKVGIPAQGACVSNDVPLFVSENYVIFQ